MEYQKYNMLEPNLFTEPKIEKVGIDPLQILAAALILAGIGYLIYQQYFKENKDPNIPG